MEEWHITLGMNWIQLAHGSWPICCQTFVNPEQPYLLEERTYTNVSVRRNRMYYTTRRGGSYREVVALATFRFDVRLPTELAAIDCLHLWIPSSFIKDFTTHSLL